VSACTQFFNEPQIVQKARKDLFGVTVQRTAVSVAFTTEVSAELVDEFEE